MVAAVVALQGPEVSSRLHKRQQIKAETLLLYLPNWGGCHMFLLVRNCSGVTCPVSRNVFHHPNVKQKTAEVSQE